MTPGEKAQPQATGRLRLIMERHESMKKELAKIKVDFEAEAGEDA